MNRRIGYIGFGSIAGGYHYTTAMREDVPFTPTAVYDLSPEARALAKERGLQAFDNLEDFLASHLFDLVVIAVPNQYHCPYFLYYECYWYELTAAALTATPSASRGCLEAASLEISSRWSRACIPRTATDRCSAGVCLPTTAAAFSATGVFMCSTRYWTSCALPSARCTAW